jgi:hypothetical protein
MTIIMENNRIVIDRKINKSNKVGFRTGCDVVNSNRY